MAWFSVWASLLLQLVVPLALLWGLSRAHWSVATFAVTAAAVAAYVWAIALAGLWLVLPWYTPFGYALLCVWIVARSARDSTQSARWPATRRERVLTIAAAVATAALLAIAAIALSARRAPAAAVNLAMPVRDGTYLVVNGGDHTLVNAHLKTLTGERFAPFRGQSYGVDLVRVSPLGFRAPGLLPSDPSTYAIFGDPVVAPCAGLVVVAVDGLPDLSPPQVDRAHMAGNHVIVECDGTWVVLGHLERGSVAVHPGDRVAVGTHIGRVGNSGNSDEPHLHVHAQRPGTTTAPLGGDPLPIRLDGRFAARNDRLRAALPHRPND